VAATDAPAAPEADPGESELVVGLTGLAVGTVAATLARSTLRAPVPPGRPGRRARELRRGFGAFFGAVAVASFAGAALHGLFPDRADTRRRPLWRLSLGAIGASAAAGIDVAAALAMPRRTAATVRAAAVAVLVGWVGILAVSFPPYRAVVALTVPSIGALAGALASRLAVPRERTGALLGLAGLGLTVGAAVVQVTGIGIGRGFGRNALYHTVQAGALVVLGRSRAALIRAAHPPRSGRRRRPRGRCRA
jgi:hypothetical protein